MEQQLGIMFLLFAGFVVLGAGGCDGCSTNSSVTVYAADYDHSCEVDFDCALVWVGGDVCECVYCGPHEAIAASDVGAYREAERVARENCRDREACEYLEPATDRAALSCGYSDQAVCVEGQCRAIAVSFDSGSLLTDRVIVKANDWVVVEVESGVATTHDAALAPDVEAEDWDVSPDGEQIVYAQPGNRDALLVIGPSDFSTPPRAIFGNPEQTGTNVRSPKFTNSGTRITFLAGEPEEGLRVWTIGVRTGADQAAVEAGKPINSGPGFQSVGARWDSDTRYALSRAFSCLEPGCGATHLGLLDNANGTVIRLSGDVQGWTLGQVRNEPDCDETRCNVAARNGGELGERDYGWLISGNAVYMSNRDQWNSWEDQTVVPHGEPQLLVYSVHNPQQFQDQTLRTDIGGRPGWRAPGVPQTLVGGGRGDFVTFIPPEDGHGVRVYRHGGDLVREHTESFSAANRPRSARFAVKPRPDQLP